MTKRTIWTVAAVIGTAVSVPAALAAQEQAERMLADRAADIDEARARAELAQAAAQLQAIRRLRKRR